MTIPQLPKPLEDLADSDLNLHFVLGSGTTNALKVGYAPMPRASLSNTWGFHIKPSEGSLDVVYESNIKNVRNRIVDLRTFSASGLTIVKLSNGFVYAIYHVADSPADDPIHYQSVSMDDYVLRQAGLSRSRNSSP